MKEILEKLTSLRGISGFEYRIADKVKEMFLPYTDEVYTDTLGNVIAIKKSSYENAKSIMIEAHMDEIGLMVREIDDRGFISFVSIGGIDRRILPGAEVIVHGIRDIKGVIGAKPPHLQESGEADKAAKLEDMAIDTGLSADEIKKMVSVGDAVTLIGDFTSLLGDNITSKTMDDRAGIAVLLDVAEKLKDTELHVNVYFVSAVCEEIGSMGAKTAGYAIEADAAIAIDVTHGITPDNSKSAFELGGGTAIAIGPNIHPALGRKLISVAKDNEIKYTIEVEGGDTGTDAWLLQVAGKGMPTALLSIPLRYMHTTVETLSVKDVEAVSGLIAEFLRTSCADMEEWLCI